MAAIRLTFTRRPNLLRIYLRALMARRRGLQPGEMLPVLSSECPEVTVDKDHLQCFLKITGAGGIPICIPVCPLPGVPAQLRPVLQQPDPVRAQASPPGTGISDPVEYDL